MLEQTLSDYSLKTIKKTLLSEAMKLKRKAREISPCNKVYHTNFKDCARAYNEVLEALDFYGITR